MTEAAFARFRDWRSV
jgi:hypothetical protein